LEAVDEHHVVTHGNEEGIGDLGRHDETRVANQQPLTKDERPAKANSSDASAAGKTGQGDGMLIHRRAGGQHRRRDYRREERSRRRLTAELTDDDCEIVQAVSRPPDPFRQVEAEPTESGGLLPKRGELVSRFVEGGSGRTQRIVVQQKCPDDPRQFLVILCDRDSHSVPLGISFKHAES
jgi:hypothetical protein